MDFTCESCDSRPYITRTFTDNGNRYVAYMCANVECDEHSEEYRAPAIEEDWTNS